MFDLEAIIKSAGEQADADAKILAEKELKNIVKRKIKFGNPEEGNKNMEKQFSFARAIKGMVTGDWSGAEFEKSAMTEGTNSNGGYLVPPEYSTNLIEQIYAKTVVRQAGASVIPMNSNVLYIPKQTGSVSTAWVGENSTITDSAQTFSQISLTAKKLVAMSIMSNELLYDSNPQVEALVMNDISNMLAIAQDTAFLQGTGTSNQPLGIINQSGINTLSMGTNGGAPTYDAIIDAIRMIQVNGKGNYRPNTLLMHPTTYYKLMKIKDSAGRYLANGVTTGVADNQIFIPSIGGLKVLTTTSIPINLTTGTNNNTSYIIAGQFDQALIGERKGIELMASNTAGTFFANDVTGIRATTRLDFALRRPEAFTTITGVDIT